MMAYEITLPRLGWDMVEGILSAWLKKEKEYVKAGEPLFAVEGDKAVQEIEALDSGYLVLLPGSEDAGISRKIEGEERIRVREMIERLRPPPGCGIIVRTAAGFDEEEGELERDLTYLQRLWENIRKHAETKRAPSLIYREHDLVLRNIRDYFTPDISEIFIDNEDVCERAKDFLHNVMPGKEHLLHLYEGEQPIFSRFGLEVAKLLTFGGPQPLSPYSVVARLLESTSLQLLPRGSALDALEARARSIVRAIGQDPIFAAVGENHPFHQPPPEGPRLCGR
jgi:hypothetical protein